MSYSVCPVSALVSAVRRAIGVGFGDLQDQKYQPIEGWPAF